MLSWTGPRASRKSPKALHVFGRFGSRLAVRLQDSLCFKAVIIAQNDVEQFALFFLLTQWNLAGSEQSPGGTVVSLRWEARLHQCSTCRRDGELLIASRWCFSSAWMFTVDYCRFKGNISASNHPGATSGPFRIGGNLVDFSLGGPFFMEKV